MRRLSTLALFVAGFASAGAFSGAVIADVTTTSPGTTTAPTTTAPPATTTTTVATTTSAAPTTLPARVRVAGVRVGGLTPAEAVAAVHGAFSRPLPVVVDTRRLMLDPRTVASAYPAPAVARARISPAGTNVHLAVAVHGAPLRAWVARVVRRFRRPAVDARLTFPGGRPRVQEERPGRALVARHLTARLAAALATNSRLPVRVRTRRVAPTVTSKAFLAVIVINREVNHLYLYRGDKLERTFHVATGQTVYPTPTGTFRIVVKWKDPWWYPPVNDSWARGLKPVPPGPSNPLGTRWMGLSAPGVGIHGTDDPGSIGYSVSHGCIRMQVPDAEWLFDHVDIGTTVHIV